MLARRIVDAIPVSIRKGLGGWISRIISGLRQRALLWRLRGDAVECNVCGWKGKRFIDDVWHPGTICPVCKSQTRHRLLMQTLTSIEEFSMERLLRQKEVLHFAPERRIRERFSSLADRYVSADYKRSDVDVNLDISRMPSVATGSFDTVIACDVLEHVSDDQRALQELFRILRPEGIAILTVPQKDDLVETIEDAFITDPNERTRRFGQHDHVRIYGQDFPGRVESAGFKVNSIGAEIFSDEIARKHVLRPLRRSTHPLATNSRKIFICRKPSV
jgi:SAM-dependent methyltransferase